MSELRFNVVATNVAPDGSRIARDLGRRPVGKVDETGLVALLETFHATVRAADDDDCDPHFTVTGHFGTFAIRAAGPALLVYDVADAARNFTKLEAAKIPAFLDYGPSGVPPEPAETAPAEPITIDAQTAPRRSGAKPAIAAFGALSALAALAVSAQLSFSPEPLDADVHYLPAPSKAEIASMRAVAAGEYQPQNSNRGALILNPDGSVRYLAREFDGSIASDRVVTSEPALLPNQNLVFRTEIGPIEIQGATAVRFAGETFVRKR